MGIPIPSGRDLCGQGRIALRGRSITFLFNFESVQNPKHLRLNTQYFVHHIPALLSLLPLVKEITDWKTQPKRYDWNQNLNVVDTLITDKRTTFQLRYQVPKWLEIRVDAIGCNAEEITPSGDGIDEVMADNAHQMYVIRIPIEEGKRATG